MPHSVRPECVSSGLEVLSHKLTNLRVRRSMVGKEVVANGKRALNMASFNFLGIAGNSGVMVRHPLSSFTCFPITVIILTHILSITCMVIMLTPHPIPNPLSWCALPWHVSCGPSASHSLGRVIPVEIVMQFFFGGVTHVGKIITITLRCKPCGHRFCYHLVLCIMWASLLKSPCGVSHVGIIIANTLML